MLKKQSQSRKKKPEKKQTNSNSKQPKQQQKQTKENKEHKISKNHHHSSALTLLSYHNASQCSLLTQSGNKVIKKTKIKNRESSISMNYKDDKESGAKQKQKCKVLKKVKKSKKSSQLNPNSKSKKYIIKISPQKVNPPKKQKLKKEQFYQRINIGLFKSKTNSEIHFSNDSSVCENRNQGKYRKILTIDCSDESILNQHFSNSRIKHNEKRRYNAAVMIQKIFRGYLTRKVLAKFIQNQQIKLVEISARMKNSSSRQSRNEEQFIGNEFEQGENKKLQKFKVQNDAALRGSGQVLNKVRFSEKDRKIFVPEEIQFSIQSQKKQQFLPIDHGALQEQSSIYYQQHDSISHFIPFNERYICVNQSQNSSIVLQTKNVNEKAQNKAYEYERYSIYEEQQQKKGKQEQKQEKYIDRGSEQYFKKTPALSSFSKSKVYDPIPTDFSQKRIHEFDEELAIKSKQYSIQQNNNRIQEFMNGNQNVFENLRSSDFTKKESKELNKIMTNQKIHESGVAGFGEGNKQKQMISILKHQQKQKWNKIIEMLSYHITKSKVKSEDNERFMQMILQFSQKNKQSLENTTFFNYQLPQNFVNQFQSQFEKPAQGFSQNHKNFRFFKKSPIRNPLQQDQFSQIDLNTTKQQIQASAKKLSKNEDMPLLCKKGSSLNMSFLHSHPPNQDSNENKINIMDKTEQLKSFYLHNYSQYPVQQMIEIREQVLEARQKGMVNKLNQDLYNNKLDQDQFIQRLSEIQQKFVKERNLINKAKMEIFIGHRATHKLMLDSFQDASYLGIKIPFSQSFKGFKGNHNHIWVKQLIVDELKAFNLGSGVKQLLKSQKDQSFVEFKQSYEEGEDQKDERAGDVPQRQEQNLKKRDSCLSVQDESLLMKNDDGKSYECSQQSNYFQDISYNEGDIEINTLNCKSANILFQDLSQSENSQENVDENLSKFNKVNFDKILNKLAVKVSEQHPLLPDPQQQQQNENEVLGKILINQNNKHFYQHLDQGLQTQMTYRRKAQSVKPKSQVYKVQLSQSQEDQQVKVEPEIKEIIEDQIEQLLWELVSEIYTNAQIRNKLCRGRSKIPMKVSAEQQLDFIQCLDRQMPNFYALKPKLNQKMTASRLELLKFMRVNFDQDQQSETMIENGDKDIDSNSQNSQVFEEIGKFEHILSSDLCTSALNIYLMNDEFQCKQKNQSFNLTEDDLSIEVKRLEQNVSVECYKKVLEREKLQRLNEIQKNDLRRQIKKIQFHCIFDALNEIIMKRRLKFNGYSGIGLNQLSMIISNESFSEINQQKQFNQLMISSKKELVELVSTDKSSAEKLLIENYEKLCENDSQWIYYTEQALSFALEFAYMLEDEILFEETAIVFKKLRKF